MRVLILYPAFCMVIAFAVLYAISPDQALQIVRDVVALAQFG